MAKMDVLSLYVWLCTTKHGNYALLVLGWLVLAKLVKPAV